MITQIKIPQAQSANMPDSHSKNKTAAGRKTSGSKFIAHIGRKPPMRKQAHIFYAVT